MVEKKKAITILEGLRGTIRDLQANPGTLTRQFKKWHFDACTAIVRIFPNEPDHLSRFQNIAFHAPPTHLTIANAGKFQDLANKAAATFTAGCLEADAILHSMTEEVRTYWSNDGNSQNPFGQKTAISGSSPIEAVDPRVVFVVHGRNDSLRESMFSFLNSIGLRPLEWSQAREATQEATPYVGHILDKAFSLAQAIVVLLTPDDEAWLRKEFHTPDEPPFETTLTGQARPNVLFEAGMAMGRDPKRTVLVEIGTLRPFSDVVGRHTVRMNNSVAQRQELANRLKTAGCPIDLSGTRWHNVGSFTAGQNESPTSFKSPESPPDISLSPAELEIIGATGPDGVITFIRVDGYGHWVRSGNTDFFDQADPSVQAEYIDALEKLLSKRFLRNEDGVSYYLTHSGFKVRKSMESKKVSTLPQ